MTLGSLERPMTLTAVRALVAALVLLPLVAPMASAAPVSFTIDVVSARSLGCSPDTFTSPDLRVRVYVNGAEVFTTEKAQDQDSPLYGHAAVVSAELPVTIGVEVEEAEPGGFFGLGTSWVPCQTGPASATRGTFIYRGEAALQAVVRGEGDKAAEALLVVGTAPPATPAVTVGATTPASVTLRWGADPTGRATGHRVALGLAGARVDANVGANEATLTVPCDNYAYAFRVIREAAPWYVTSADVSATSANAAPQPATVLSATRDGNASFESPTTHDIARYEVHASSSASFTPSSATLRHTISSPSSAFAEQSAAGIPFSASDTHVRIRSVDTGGLSADSASFAIGASARQGSIRFGSSCVPTTTSAGSASWPTTTTSTAPPPSPTPTPPISPTPTPPVSAEGEGQVRVDVATVFEIRPLAPVDLSNETMRIAPGGTIKYDVMFLNRGPVPLEIDLQPALTLREDVDLGMVFADGWTGELSGGSFRLNASSKVTLTYTITAPEDAVIGERANLSQPIEVTQRFAGGHSTEGGFFWMTPLLVVEEDAIAGSAGAEADASLSLSTVVAIGGIGAGAAGLGALAWLRRDAARFAVAAALYTRLGKSEMLQHAGREDLLQRITREPGICYTDLKRATEMNTGAIVHHLRAMERTSLITSRKEGAFRRFYAMGAVPAAASGMVRAVPKLTPMQARVVALLEEAPLTQAEMAERLGLSQQGMSHHVKALERAGHIAPEFDGKAWRYSVVHRFEVMG